MKRTITQSIGCIIGGTMLLQSLFATAQDFYSSDGAAEPSPEVKEAFDRHNTSSQGQAGQIYDGEGSYQGKVDRSGRMYDSEGEYQGRVDGSGRIFDSEGTYSGQRDEEGNLYDEDGTLEGRVEN